LDWVGSHYDATAKAQIGGAVDAYRAVLHEVVDFRGPPSEPPEAERYKAALQEILSKKSLAAPSLWQIAERALRQ
jgi:hypothetical protein